MKEAILLMKEYAPKVVRVCYINKSFTEVLLQLLLFYIYSRVKHVRSYGT